MGVVLMLWHRLLARPRPPYPMKDGPLLKLSVQKSVNRRQEISLNPKRVHEFRVPGRHTTVRHNRAAKYFGVDRLVAIFVFSLGLRP